MLDLRPMSGAPRDGTEILGRVGGDLIRMFFHPGFGEFISSFRRLQMAPGYLIDGQPYQDHSPLVHHPTGWLHALEEESDV